MVFSVNCSEFYLNLNEILINFNFQLNLLTLKLKHLKKDYKIKDFRYYNKTKIFKI